MNKRYLADKLSRIRWRSKNGKALSFMFSAARKVDAELDPQGSNDGLREALGLGTQCE